MQLGLTRRNIGRLVLLAWAVALAWLARRELAGGTPSTAELVRRLEPSAQFFAVMAGDRQIGQLNRTVDTLVDGVRLTELLVLDLPDGDTTRQLAQLLEANLSRGLRLRQFSRSTFGLGRAERLTGGTGTDSTLTLRDFEANLPASSPVSLYSGPDPVLPAMIPLRAAFERPLEVGDRLDYSLFDVGTGLLRPVAVRVVADSVIVVPDSAVWSPPDSQWVPAGFDTIPVFRLEHDAPGVSTSTWVDRQGSIVAEEIQGGYRLVRSAFEIVSTNYRQLRRSESSGWRRGVPGLGLTEFGGHVAPAARGFRITDWTGADLVRSPNPPADPSQPPGDSLMRWRLPFWDLGVLQASEVREEAATALRGAATRIDSVKQLTGWVARRIGTDGSPRAFGTAMNTLLARRGSQDGKARLLVTLARSVGIPARVLRGVEVRSTGVVGRSWTELWADGWIAVDPVSGDVPAGKALLPIAVGERSLPTDLVPLLASARFLPIALSR